jgi:internalin A
MAQFNKAAFKTAEIRIQKAFKSRAKELDLSTLALTDLPESIANLTYLQTLDLYNNQLSTLPEIIGNLTNLQKINLSYNQLNGLPESIGKINNLRTLSISTNQLTSLPESIGNLINLQEFNLHRNQLSALPESIGNLTNLQTLFLSHNKISILPEKIDEMSQLQWIDLYNNQLRELPESIGNLINLQKLYLSQNQLRELPESIGNLVNLQRLYLSQNQLRELPESLLRLTSLKELYLHGNDKLGLPTEVLGPTYSHVLNDKARPIKPISILDYYFQNRKGSRPLNEAKMILVGRGDVGKTSLVNRLLFNRFNKNEERTPGIAISEWKIRLRDSEEVRLNIWDFGGQEIMHATHRFFLTQRSLYLLVLEGRQGVQEADADYWLKMIESFGTESEGETAPVIVVLNKINLNPFELNRRALQGKYPFIKEFIFTDCKDGTGIGELRKLIERETDRLKHLRDEFPADWFAIKDNLAGMKKNFITYEEYQKLCTENGEKEIGAQNSLATHLHNLGIALNFKDDPRLCDMHVLNPHWVTNGIYKILNSPLLAKQKGELRLADTRKILSARSGYPGTMHRFLFDLMKKFGLCFTFHDDDTHYLIPELLGIQEPDETGRFKPEDCLNFEYRYTVLPEGLLPKFIVRTHSMSEGLARWRTGVILKFERNEALVKADAQEKKVFISVNGEMTGRRRLLTVIRSDFERIHAEISKLKPEEWVPLPGYLGEAVSYEDLLTYERDGERNFKKPIRGKLVPLDVQELLNGVDLEGTRRPKEPVGSERPIRLFYSYSHKDEALRNDLETHLKLLQRVGFIDQWHDRMIEAGDDWKSRIDENLERANIILLLVSADFIASHYCYEIEMKRALEKHKSGEATVIPIILRHVNWKRAPFAKLQALPKDGKAVMKWKDKDSAWTNVSEGIETLVEELRKKRI